MAKLELEPLVGQVGVEGGQLFGQEHALVDQRARRQRTDVEIIDLLGPHRLFDAAADDVEVQLELFVGDVLVVADDDLFDLGPGRVGLFADDVDVHRHLTPAVDVVAEGQDLGLDDAAAGFLRIQADARQEHLADRQIVVGRAVADDLDVVLEELLRDLDMDAGAVAGLAVGVHGAAMPDRLQRLDALLDHRAARLAVDRGDEADAAGVMLILRVVGVGSGQRRGVGAELFDELLTLVQLGGHGETLSVVMSVRWGTLAPRDVTNVVLWR